MTDIEAKWCLQGIIEYGGDVVGEETRSSAMRHAIQAIEDRASMVNARWVHEHVFRVASEAERHMRGEP